MTIARTKVSNWIYRLALLGLIVGTIRHGQFMYDQFPTTVREAGTAVYWTALLGVMSSTVGFAFAAIAMLFRSGAVVWLLGLQLGLMCLTLAPTLLNANTPEPAIIMVVLTTIVLVITGVLFTYLIRREEIRSL